jgi:hypothetical protein
LGIQLQHLSLAVAKEQHSVVLSHEISIAVGAAIDACVNSNDGCGPSERP